MENKFIIRKAILKDLESILALNFKLFKKEYKEFDKGLNMSWTYGDGKKIFKEAINSSRNFVEVAEFNGKIIGYISGGKGKWGSYRKNFDIGFLDNMFVEKNFRNKGLGTQLVNDFINWCKKNKIKTLEVSASFSNFNSLSLYRKFGFKERDIILEAKL